MFSGKLPSLSRKNGASLASLLAVVLAATPSQAYQRTMTCTRDGGIFACEAGEEPKGIRWKDRDISYVINQVGSDDLALGSDGKLSPELREAIALSFSPWTEPECSHLKISDGGETALAAIGFDRDAENTNLIVWQEDWPYDGDADAYALTSVTFSASTGIISDADIELNGEYFTWSILDQPEADQVDLRNTLTHEVGHFVGFDHSADFEATMYGRAPLGEVSKRTLAQDDLDGLCAVYVPETEVEEDTSRGCQSASLRGGHAPAEALLGALALLALCGVTRRRQER